MLVDKKLLIENCNEACMQDMYEIFFYKLCILTEGIYLKSYNITLFLSDFNPPLLQLLFSLLMICALLLVFVAQMIFCTNTS